MSKTYLSKKGDVQAIKSFSLDVQNGEFVALLGESGCGKSTLLDLAAGLNFPTKGKVFLDGEEIRAPNKTTGVVFQGYPLINESTVFENVALGYKIRNESVPKQKIYNILAKVGLRGFEQSKPDALSGGMAQRAAIARAIVASPDVLLLDEPFAALDALTKRELQDEVRNLSTEHNMTTVIITHDFDEAVRIADRIVLLTPRPGTTYKEYRNEVGNEPLSIRLRDEIVKDIYAARRFKKEENT